MKQQHKYLLVLTATNLTTRQEETNDDAQVVAWLASFRSEEMAPRVELYTIGFPGFERWDKHNYYVEADATSGQNRCN